MGKKILILSGGGAKGAFQAGVIEQLQLQKKWFPDVVMGVSVGALNGAMVATGKAGRLTGLWRNIHPDMVYKERGAVRTGWRYLLHKAGVRRPTLGYFDNEPLFKTLRSNLGNQFITNFYCGTVDLNSGLYHEHNMTKGMVPWNFLDRIVASTAIPVVFDPITIRANKQVHIDGGVRHMSPLGVALKKYEPEEIVIVTCTPYKRQWMFDYPARDIIDIAKTSMSIVLDEIFEKDLREFERINRIVEQAADQGAAILNGQGRRYQKVKATLYQPEESLGDSLNFHPEQAVENIEKGLNAKPIEL